LFLPSSGNTYPSEVSPLVFSTLPPQLGGNVPFSVLRYAWARFPHEWRPTFDPFLLWLRFFVQIPNEEPFSFFFMSWSFFPKNGNRLFLQSFSRENSQRPPLFFSPFRMLFPLGSCGFPPTDHSFNNNKFCVRENPFAMVMMLRPTARNSLKPLF